MERRNLYVVPGESEAKLEELSDDDLYTLVQIDRQDAFEVVVRRHQGTVLGIAARYLGDRQAGLDVAQDVFLALWAKRGEYRGRGRFASYLVAVTLNRCRYVLRQKGTRERKHTEIGQERGERAGRDSKVPLAELIESERAREVHEKLALLPERQRDVVVLRFAGDLSLEEISSTTGMPLGTVKSYLSRGLERLYKSLQKVAK